MTDAPPPEFFEWLDTLPSTPNGVMIQVGRETRVVPRSVALAEWRSRQPEQRSRRDPRCGASTKPADPARPSAREGTSWILNCSPGNAGARWQRSLTAKTGSPADRVGDLVAVRAEDVNCRARGHEIGLGTGLEPDTGAVMHGDRVGHHLPAFGEHSVAVGELAGQRRAAHGEVDVRHGAWKPSVVEHGGEVEQLTVKRDPASCGDGGCPGVRTMGAVSQHRNEEVLGGLLGISGQQRVRGCKARRFDGAASRTHAQGHRQQADQDAELFAQQRPGQRHALSNGEHAAVALGPSDRPERVAGACAAAAIGGGRRRHWLFAVVNLEREHHPGLVMLGDMAVRHPCPGVHVEQNVDSFARSYEYGVLPDEVPLLHVVSGENQEPAGAVDVKTDAASDGRSPSR